MSKPSFRQAIQRFLARRERRDSERGSTLLIALLVSGALSILASAVILATMGDRNLTRYDRHSLQALGAAETGVAFAKRAIVNMTAPLQDYDSDGRPDFVLEDSLSNGGSYRVVAEASDIKGIGVTAYHSNGFTIVSEGTYLGAVRRVKVEIVHDSFLKFARYVSIHSLSFGCGDLIEGEVYAGNSINLSCGCPAGLEPHFLEKVYAVGPVPQATCGNFELGYVEFGEEIDFLGSVDWNDLRDRARGLASNSSCDGMGSVGIYMNLPGLDPLNLGSQTGWDQNAVVYDYFDFYNTTVQPPDTIVTYAGAPVINSVTGQPMQRSEFNGMIFFEGDAAVRGTLDGTSGFRVSTFGTGRVLIRGDIFTGHTGFDPATRLPNGSGEPITTAVIGEDYVAMDTNTKRVLTIEAAIFSRSSNWRCLGGIGDHPIGGPGPLDLDLDGYIGETPVNDDPIPGEGWDELVITEHHWILNTTGPIITYSAGDAYPWTAGPVLGQASGSTRRMTYDLAFEDFPPACFPVPLNLWRDVSWTEIFSSNDELASHLPE